MPSVIYVRTNAVAKLTAHSLQLHPPMHAARFKLCFKNQELCICWLITGEATDRTELCTANIQMLPCPQQKSWLPTDLNVSASPLSTIKSLSTVYDFSLTQAELKEMGCLDDYIRSQHPAPLYLKWTYAWINIYHILIRVILMGDLAQLFCLYFLFICIIYEVWDSPLMIWALCSLKEKPTHFKWSQDRVAKINGKRIGIKGR